MCGDSQLSIKQISTSLRDMYAAVQHRQIIPVDSELSTEDKYLDKMQLKHFGQEQFRE